MMTEERVNQALGLVRMSKKQELVEISIKKSSECEKMGLGLYYQVLLRILCIILFCFQQNLSFIPLIYWSNLSCLSDNSLGYHLTVDVRKLWTVVQTLQIKGLET